MFAQGAPLTGELENTGIGAPKDECSDVPLADPLDGERHAQRVTTRRAPAPLCPYPRAPGAAQRNRRCIARLRADEHEDALWQALLDDVERGRMTAPVPAESLDLGSVVLTPRFSVAQGPKIRPVDDATASELNGCTRCAEKMRHDTIDLLVEAARLERAAHGPALPHFWKADVDAAFRRIPLQPSSAHLAHVAFLREGEPMTARHRSVFFGATSSVHNWERVGALLAAILRRVVHIPALRYVDDFFGVEAAALAQHTNECGPCHSPPPERAALTPAPRRGASRESSGVCSAPTP